MASVQIILNAFRLKPLEQVLPAAADGRGRHHRAGAAGVRPALGHATTRHQFAADDHRSYNRDGSAFDVGETFSGVDYETGVAAAEEFTELVASSGPAGITPAQAAIAWVWQQPGVSTVIPGARNVRQATSNAAAGAVEPLGEEFLRGVEAIYDAHFRASVHGRW